MADQDLARRESVAIRAVRRRVLTRWIATLPSQKRRLASGAITEAPLDRDHFFSTTHERKSHDDRINPQTDRLQVRSHAR
jgi:hypothetical protein